ncbi:MAG: lamin tail domain-containing protein [Planctomycetes bacterium]|nr:lamin tail domain-containing protein [Planctomycetota bacterium]
MLDLVLLVAPALLGSPQGPASGALLLNEAVVDDEGSDDREFVELFNRSAQRVDLGGCVLEVLNRRGLRASYAVPANTFLEPCSHFVLGSPSVPNVDLPLGTGDLFYDAQAGALVLKDPQGVELDRLVYHATFGLWTNAGGAGEGFWGESTSFNGFETSISRWRDGWNDQPERAWVLQRATPGEPNAQEWRAEGLDDFTGALGSAHVAWQGTRAPLVRVDPRQVGPLDSLGRPWNPSALPRDSASAGGSGGACGVVWSPAGGGSAALWRSDPVAELEAEGLFWLRSDALPLAQMETWSFGIQGSTDAYARLADPSGAIGFVRSGNTGVAWILQALDSGATLYLVDHGDGGWAPLARSAPTLLATILIRPGVNDGWQRLRLRASQGQLEAELGGVLGVPGSGQVVRAALQQPAIGGVYLGYDRLLDAALARPLSVDDLRLTRLGTPPLAYFGSGVATPSGAPALHAPYSAAPGEARFALELSGLAPQAVAHFALGARALSPPLDLGALGATSGSTLDVDPELVCIALADAQGRAVLALPIRCAPELRGQLAYAQGFALDPRGSAAIPLASSRALRIELR